MPHAASMHALRVGVVGTGKMGLNHLRAIAGCEGVRLVGVADPRADRDAIGPLLPAGAALVPSVRELFDQANPQVIHIVTPPGTHATLALEVLQRGAHAYVEKPFALSAGEAQSVLRMAAERGLSVCAGHQCLFDDAAVKARSLLHNLGNVVHVQSYFSFRTVRRGISPVDQAKDILPHAVYMLLDFMRLAAPERASEAVAVKSVDAAADGSVHALLALGPCRGSLVITLTGRPVAQYLDVVGTNGCARIDLVSGSVVALPGPGASAVAAMLEPYRRAWQLVTGSTAGFVGRFRERKYGYPGLRALLSAFYEHAARGAGAPPVCPASILETVTVCEAIGRHLDDADATHEQHARALLMRRERELPPADASRGTVLVTGASGFLGQAVVSELRAHRRAVRGIVRQPVRFSARAPGVEYVTCDLAEGVPQEIMDGVQTVVHCAAETRGGKADQERNSVEASRAVVEAAAQANVRTLIHISSVAVIKPGSRVLDEESPIDVDNLDRGPYVWGKAVSERLVQTLGAERGLEVRIIRLGPLVRAVPVEVPGRLGRELGPLFVAVGPRKSRIALIDVDHAAAVVRLYADDPENQRPIVNLVEPASPTRAELVAGLRASRPDLKVLWIPLAVVRLVSTPLVWLQKMLGRKPALDIASAFVGQRYRTALAEHLLERARSAGSRRAAPQAAGH